MFNDINANPVKSQNALWGGGGGGGGVNLAESIKTCKTCSLFMEHGTPQQPIC